MIFSDTLYADPKLSGSYKKVIKNIDRDKIPASWFLIARPASGKFPFNIYPAYVLKEKYYRELDDVVVAVASSRDEAMKLAGTLAARQFETHTED